MRVSRGRGQRHHYLAIGHLAQRAAVLPLHAHRVRTGLFKGGVIQNQRLNRSVRSQLLQSVAAGKAAQVGIAPRRITEEVQQGPMGGVGGGGVGAEQSGDGLHTLEGKVGDQAQHIGGEAGALATIPQEGADRDEVLLQAGQRLVGDREVHESA